jgi:predicted transcriptional regulator of viral defense system
MNYYYFRRSLNQMPIFNTADISKLDEKVYHHRLVDWQKKGYIERLANGAYRFLDLPVDEHLLYFIANKIYEPSYVSLESALAYYGIIPEAVYSVTSVCSKKTSTFKTNISIFYYRKIKSRYLFGYKIIRKNQIPVKIADVEKAIIDFLYFNSNLKSVLHFEGLRLNKEILLGKLDKETFNSYLHLYENKQLNKRAELFLKWLYNA